LHLGGTTTIGYDVKDESKTADVNDDLNWSELFLDNSSTRFVLEDLKCYVFDLQINAAQDTTISGATPGSYTAGANSTSAAKFLVQRQGATITFGVGSNFTGATGNSLGVGLGFHNQMRFRVRKDEINNRLLFEAYGIQHDGDDVNVRWHVVLHINELLIQNV
jgi:hypothetical protein